MVSISLLQLVLEVWGALITLACAIATTVGKKIYPQRRFLLALLLFMNTVLLFNDSLALAFRGNESLIACFIVRISNFLVFILLPIMIITFGIYIFNIINSNNGELNLVCRNALFATSGIHIFVILITPFTNFLYYFDEHNLYHRSAAFGIATILGIVQLLILMITILKHSAYIEKIECQVLLLFILLPMASSVFQNFHYGLSLNNLATTMALMLLFLLNEVKKSNYLYEQRKLLMDQEMALKDQQLRISQHERELAEARLQISLSQMQPHFVFNALGSIEQLCRMDSKKAAEATHYFARYLRNNLHALNVTDTQTFSAELSHVRSYIWLEKMRFGDDLCFIESIHSSDFQIPILTIQPLIENAVKHGMMSFDEGILHITLTVTENIEEYQILLNDDGMGFVPEISSEEHFRESIFFNISERLKLMCNGTIQMKTIPGQGTVYTIIIPKNKSEKEE